MRTTFSPVSRERTGSVNRGNCLNTVSPSLKKALSEENACYVLITCKKPSEDGQMQVEMVYEGDACLAAYLLESAQGFIE